MAPGFLIFYSVVPLPRVLNNAPASNGPLNKDDYDRTYGGPYNAHEVKTRRKGPVSAGYHEVDEAADDGANDAQNCSAPETAGLLGCTRHNCFCEEAG